MKKIITLLIICIFGIFFVGASSLKECQRTMFRTDIPCIQPTSYLPSGPCDSYNISIIDQNNVSIENLTFYSAPMNCQFVFTHNTPNIYFWNSSIESGVITVEAENNMIAIILVFILLIAYFAIIGVINPNGGLKFLCYSLSIIELIIMVGVIYISEEAGDYLILLKTNFYAILIVGFGLGMLTFFIKSAETLNMGSDESIMSMNNQGDKWKDSKW